MRTIRARLYLAFGMAAGMTVIGSLFALFAFATIGATLSAIVFRSMPAPSSRYGCRRTPVTLLRSPHA